jgi:hypothetical protein
MKSVYSVVRTGSRITATHIIFTRVSCTLFTCDMYMCRLRHINDPVLSSLKMDGICLLFHSNRYSVQLYRCWYSCSNMPVLALMCNHINSGNPVQSYEDRQSCAIISVLASGKRESLPYSHTCKRPNLISLGPILIFKCYIYVFKFTLNIALVCGSVIALRLIWIMHRQNTACFKRATSFLGTAVVTICGDQSVKGGPGSVVGMATGYGLDGPGIESRGARFPAPVHTGPGAHPAFCTMGTGSFPGVKSGRGVTPTLTPLLVPLVIKD